jgi:hypothetical protein
MAFERVAELQIEVEHGVAFVAAVMLEAGRMDAACPAGAQRTTLEGSHGRKRPSDGPNY